MSGTLGMKPTYQILVSDQPVTVWSIPGYPEYSINENGVFSRKSGEWKGLKTPGCKSTGYMTVNLTGARSKQTTHAFHKLLYCSAVLGEIISGHELVVGFKDSNRRNNALTNLERMPLSEAMRRGRSKKG